MFDPKPNPAAPNLVDGINLSESMAQKPNAPASPQGGSFTPSAPAGQGMEDIFAETEQQSASAGPASLGQNSGPKMSSAPVNPVLPEPLMQLPDDAEEETGGNKKFFWVGLAVLIVILAVGGYFAYAKFFAEPSALNLPQFNINSLSPAEVNRQYQDEVINFGNNNASDTVNNNQNQNSNNNQNVNNDMVLPAPQDSSSDENTNLPASPNQGEPEPTMDSDKDGLSDQEENNLGTNPDNPDSDNDGLSDREEARVYLTDPLNPDSDGDGYLDGAEVENGYNPKGAGTLLEINF